MARTGGAVASGIYLQSGTLPAFNSSLYTWNLHYMNPNAPGVGTSSYIFQISGGTSNLDIGLQWDRTANGCSAYHLAAAGYKFAVVGTGLNGNQWYWLAGVSDGTNLTFYVNGVSTAFVGTVGPDRTDLSYNLQVFIRKDGASYAFEDDGHVEHFSWWPGVALSPDQIASLAGGIYPVNVHPTGMLALWPLRGDDSPERAEGFVTAIRYPLNLVNTPTQYKNGPPGNIFVSGVR